MKSKNYELKNPNWHEADQVVIYKQNQGAELASTEKQLHLVVRAGLEPMISGFKVCHPNHSAIVPHLNPVLLYTGSGGGE